MVQLKRCFKNLIIWVKSFNRNIISLYLIKTKKLQAYKYQLPLLVFVTFKLEWQRSWIYLSTFFKFKTQNQKKPEVFE